MNTPTVDICIATYRRPLLLEGLLQSLHAQVLPPGTQVRWIVVDNDPDGSARPVADRATQRGWPLTYLTQPEKNIALTRNKALDAAGGDFLAFIDDDEVATPQWLARLLETMQAFEADVVFGPVQGVLPADVPAWIRRCGAFERPGRATGTRMSLGAAGNVLIRRTALSERGHRFDAGFGLTGGEDTDFFWRLNGTGAKLVWCQEALATESVEPSRLSARWILRREFSTGQTYADIVGRPRGGSRLWAWFGHRTALALVGTTLALLAAPWSRAAGMRWARKAAANFGQLSSLHSARVKAYAHVPPAP